MSWRDKILTGYLYQISDTVLTGSGGAINFGEAMEKKGWSDEVIQENILVTNDGTLKTNTKFIPIKYLVIKKHE